MTDCEELISPALQELVGEFKIKDADPGCVVVTPFQHTDGDLIRLWIEADAGDYFSIRDYGETFGMLRLYGVDPDTEKRSNRIDNIVHQFDLEPSSEEIRNRVSEDSLASGLLNTLQAVQAVSYLVYTHQTGKATRFNTEVEGYLKRKDYDFETGFSVKGERTDRKFDIAINHRYPEVLLDTIHTNNKTYLNQRKDVVLLNWYELQERDYKHGVIIDDVDGIYREDTLEGLIDTLDYFFKWSEKERIEREIPVKAT